MDIVCCDASQTIAAITGIDLTVDASTILTSSFIDTAVTTVSSSCFAIRIGVLTMHLVSRFYGEVIIKSFVAQHCK